MKPLQIDILLLRKEQGELPAGARQVLAGLVEHLGELTLLEFKSPSDTLRAGDFRTFLAYAFLYCAQNEPLLEPHRLHLLVLAPRLTRPYRDELRVLGVTAEQQEPGIWRLQDGPVIHPAWVLETEALAGLNHPLLTLFSPRFLADRVAIYDTFREVGYSNLVVYLAQQIHQFHRQGKEFAMQHLGVDQEFVKAMRDLWESMTPDEREAFWPAEELVKKLSPEKRLQGLSPEDLLRALAPEERDRLRQLLQTQTKSDDPSRSQ